MRSLIILIAAMAFGCGGVVGPKLETNPTGDPVNVTITVDLTISGDGPVSAGGYVDFITPDGDDQHRTVCPMTGGQHFCRAAWSPKNAWRVGDQIRITVAKLNWAGLFRDGVVLNATKRLGITREPYRSPMAENEYGTARFEMTVTRR